MTENRHWRRVIILIMTRNRHRRKSEFINSDKKIDGIRKKIVGNRKISENFEKIGNSGKIVENRENREIWKSGNLENRENRENREIRKNRENRENSRNSGGSEIWRNFGIFFRISGFPDF
jgi:hypothetical protein